MGLNLKIEPISTCNPGAYSGSLHTAKISTLGERIEDVLLIDGPALANPKTQIQLETDLLKVLSEPV